MTDVNLLAVLAATVAAFVSGGAYYSVFGAQLDSDGSMPPWKLAVELLRCLILAAVVAGVVAQGDVDSWTGGALLGIALWVGFPLVLWIGAVIHESTPVKLAAIHAGDWLVKLLLVAVIATI